MTVETVAAKDRLDPWLGGILLAASLALHVWLTFTVGFHNQGLLGQEFRQTQTAISAYWIQKEGVSLDYPTPVLGEPWSAPMEFPLYHTAVVAVANTTGLPLAESGRLVSVLCFYLMLPGAWLVLGVTRISAGRKAIILALILTSPMYLFYSRTFLIEAMGLATSVWWLAAFLRTIRTRSWGWLLATNLLGVASALGKVTTFAVFLIPGAFFGFRAIWETWQNEKKPWQRIGNLCLWGAGTVALPLSAAMWWVRLADSIKAKNPAAKFLLSDNLTDFNFGTWSLRLSSEFWVKLWEYWSLYLVAPSVFALVVLFALLPGRGQWRRCLVTFGFFLAAQLVFSNLYFLHDYYFYANAILLLAAIGFALIQVLDAPYFPHWLRAAFVLLVIGLQLQGYYRTYYQDQRLEFLGGSGLIQAIREITPEDGVLAIYGEDWASITPYYAQRKALMIPSWRENDIEGLKESLSLFTGSGPSVLIVTGNTRKNLSLFETVAPLFKLDRRALLKTPRSDLYIREDLYDAAAEKLRGASFHNVTIAIEGQLRDQPPSNEVVAVDTLKNKAVFSRFIPEPVRFRIPYGLSAVFVDNQKVLNAHATSELFFKAPAGATKVNATYGVMNDAFVHGNETDGVEFVIALIAPDGTETVLHRVLLDPLYTAEDRGMRTVKLEFADATGSELVFRTLPGPRGNAAFDWGYWGLIEIR